MGRVNTTPHAGYQHADLQDLMLALLINCILSISVLMELMVSIITGNISEFRDGAYLQLQ